MIIWLYKLSKNLLYLYLKIIGRIKIIGRENIPAEGALLVVSNHVSLLDPPIVGSAMTRPVNFMAKEELFKYPIFGPLLKKVGAFPVRRGKGDRKALKQAFKVLRNQEVLGMYPEGNRRKQGNLGRAKGGSVLIPIKMKVSILPIGIKFYGKKVRVSIGKPFDLQEFYDRKLEKEDMKEAGQIIMDKIKKEIDSI